MAGLKEGERVRVVDRPATAADSKSGLYYDYFRGLTGTVFKVYETGDRTEVAVDIDVDTLPEEVAGRHFEARDRMRASMSAEARRLSAPGAENEFRLRYVVLLSAADLSSLEPAAKRRGAGGRSRAA